MRFQKRDGEILKFIYYVGDGAVSRRHLKQVFWPDINYDRALDKRLSKLSKEGYVEWPTREQYRINPIPERERVVWLGPKGAWWISAEHQIEQDGFPSNVTETWCRNLEKKLRRSGIRWLRRPRWIQIVHDLAVVDFHLAMRKALQELPYLVLESWVNESRFRSEYDVVEYKIKGRDGKVRQGKRGVQPDRYFGIVDEKRRARGEPYRARFLLEIDMCSKANPTFGKEKVLPYAGYIGDAGYKARFGDNSGHWLVVTTGPVRRNNLMEETWRKAGQLSIRFWFTTLDQLEKPQVNVLTSPIWRQAGEDDPKALFP